MSIFLLETSAVFVLQSTFVDTHHPSAHVDCKWNAWHGVMIDAPYHNVIVLYKKSQS